MSKRLLTWEDGAVRGQGPTLPPSTKGAAFLHVHET